MDRETDIFDADIQEPSSGDLDVDLVNAGQLLQKLAEEEGIDLNSLPDDVVEDLIRDIIDPQPHIQQPQETRKEASAMDQDTQIPDEPTYADVAVELSKIAAENGIDLAQVSREEYHEAFADLATMMADPAYSYMRQVETEEEAKLASAYMQGQVMADGFLDRLKEAEDEETKEAAGAVRAAIYRGTQKAKEMLGKGVGKGVGLGRKMREGAKRVAATEQEIAERVGKVMPKSLSQAVAKRMSGPAHERLRRARRAIGRATLGGAGAAGVGMAGAGYAMGRSKESFDEAAYEVAANLVREMGFDPETGYKLAAAEPEVTEDFSPDALAERAIEMLKEAGYLP